MFSGFRSMIVSFFGARKIEEPVDLGALSVSERIARDFGFLGAADDDDAVEQYAEHVEYAGDPVVRDAHTVTIDVTEVPPVVAKQMPIVGVLKTDVAPIETLSRARDAIAGLPVSAGADDEVRQFETEAAALECFSGDSIVWMNTVTGTYHEKGARWYGATKQGAYARRPVARETRELVLR
jgi:hypothetical protein